MPIVFHGSQSKKSASYSSEHWWRLSWHAQRKAHVQSLEIASRRPCLPPSSELFGTGVAIFALTYLSKSLNIPPPHDQSGKPTVEELNRILLNHLVQRRGQHVRVWCTLELESDLCAGVQRIRCNPFKLKKDKVYCRIFFSVCGSSSSQEMHRHLFQTL